MQNPNYATIKRKLLSLPFEFGCVVDCQISSGFFFYISMSICISSQKNEEIDSSYPLIFCFVCDLLKAAGNFVYHMRRSDRDIQSVREDSTRTNITILKFYDVFSKRNDNRYRTFSIQKDNR